MYEGPYLDVLSILDIVNVPFVLNLIFCVSLRIFDTFEYKLS